MCTLYPLLYPICKKSMYVRATMHHVHILHDACKKVSIWISVHVYHFLMEETLETFPLTFVEGKIYPAHYSLFYFGCQRCSAIEDPSTIPLPGLIRTPALLPSPPHPTLILQEVCARCIFIRIICFSKNNTHLTTRCIF